MNDVKSLLIIGNGSNLHMNLPTKWEDYWSYKRSKIFKSLPKDIDTNIYFSNLSHMFDGCDDYSKIGSSIPRSEVDTYIKCFEEYIKNNIINYDNDDYRDLFILGYVTNQIMMNGKHDIEVNINWCDIFLCWLSFVRVLSIKDFSKNKDAINSSFNIDNWMDIEHILNYSITLFDGNEKEAYPDAMLPEFFKTNTSLLWNIKLEDWIQAGVYLGFQYEALLEHRSQNKFNKKVALEYINKFEKDFTDYLLYELNDLFYDNSDMTKKYTEFLYKLMSTDYFTKGYHSGYYYDILDFNYEPLRRIIGNIKIESRRYIENIYQPHGNVDKGVVIGGNYRGEVHGIGSSKFLRKKALLYTSDGDVKETTYSVDLSKYDSVVIYGWSISYIDQLLFERKDALSLNHDVVITVVTSVSLDELDIRQKLKDMCDDAGVRVKEVVFKTI